MRKRLKPKTMNLPLASSIFLLSTCLSCSTPTHKPDSSGSQQVGTFSTKIDLSQYSNSQLATMIAEHYKIPRIVFAPGFPKDEKGIFGSRQINFDTVDIHKLIKQLTNTFLYIDLRHDVHRNDDFLYFKCYR